MASPARQSVMKVFQSGTGISLTKIRIRRMILKRDCWTVSDVGKRAALVHTAKGLSPFGVNTLPQYSANARSTLTHEATCILNYIKSLTGIVPTQAMYYRV